ncbi:hypothetical protein [Micromonospora sp. CB01531]|uniref:hypothetical protein n=1 Tax=Micromonospora sp. CB01531 TaxID=1718947 RepID=UPI000AB84694|nr:hypothetical protein [Micromonospora sp. CB01531]
MIWNLRDNEEWLTAAELADRLGVTIWTVYKWRDPKEWKNPADALTTVRIDGVDHSPLPEAAAIDRGKRDETRGAPRLAGAAAT